MRGTSHFDFLCLAWPGLHDAASKAEALKTAQRASLAELDALFATFQHRAFRGEL